MARRSTSELERILGGIDPAKLKGAAFGLGAEYDVFEGPKPAGKLIRHFEDQGRLRNLLSRLIDTLNLGPDVENRLSELSNPLPPRSPNYKLLAVQVSSAEGQESINVSELKDVLARWFQVQVNEVVLMGAIKERTRLGILIGLPTNATERGVFDLQRMADQNAHAFRPYSIASFLSLPDKTRTDWQDLVTLANKRQSYDVYRPYTSWREARRRKTIHIQFWGVLLLIVVLGGILAYPSFMRWMQETQAQAEVAWTGITIQTSSALKTLEQALGSLLRQAFVTAAAWVVLIGLTVAVFPLEKLIYKRETLPPVLDSALELYTRYGWGILTAINVFGSAISLLVASFVVQRPLNLWEWIVQGAIILAAEYWGVKWVVAGIEHITNKQAPDPPSQDEVEKEPEKKNRILARLEEWIKRMRSR